MSNAWTPIRDLPATRLYLDAYGNVRRRSIATGRFVSGTIMPGYGQLGYGETVTLDARRTEASDE